MMNLKAKKFTIISTNIIILLMLACFISVSANAEESSGTKKIEAQTLQEFSKQQGGSLASYVNKISKDGKAKVIPCGTNECNPETQKCIACTFKDKGWTQIFTLERNTIHYCVDKSTDPASYNMQYRSLVLTKNEYSCKEVSIGAVDKHTLLGITISKTDNCKYDGSNKKKYCFNIVGDNQEITLEYGNDDTAMKGCEVLPVKLYNMRKCFFCPLFSVVFSAAEKMPAISFSKLAAAFATLIALGLAIWIAVQTLTHVSSLTKQDAPKFLAGLIKQSYKFLIAFLLLQYGNQIFEYAVNPVLKAGIDFGGHFLEVSASDGTKDAIQMEIDERAKKVNAHGFYISENTENRELDKELYKKLDYYVSSIQREIAFMQAVGSSLICTGNGKMFSKVSTTTFAQGFKMILQGLILAVFGFLLSIAFAFYMIDAVVQLGIVGALMPFLIASWPFKVTSQYAGTGFKMLLNSAFIFVFIGLTVEVNMQLVNAALTNNVSSDKVTIQRSDSDDVSFGGLQDIAYAINTQNDTELVELTDISTMGFLILIFCCIFGFKFMGQVSSLAGQFSSGGIKPSAPSIATMGASAALSGAKKVTKPVREAVGRKAEDAEMAVVGAVAHPIRTAKSIGRSITSFANKFRGGKGGGDSDSESETTVENKEKSKSGTVENNGKPNGDKKKSPVVGQNNANKEKTTVTAANIKPGSNGSGENHNTAGDEKNVNNEGGSQGDNSVNEVNTNNETSADNNSAPLNTCEPKEHKADSRKQRKYSGKKNRDRLQKNKQRRNYGRKHK